MFEYIKGILTESNPSQVTIEAYGIGYLLLIPLNNYSKLPQVGEPFTIYVSTVIREDSHKNYGFLTRDQRNLFENLINISGIGPKTALALLGHMEIDDLQSAITQGSSTLLSKIPGIGKKTAERLIVEMRDKIKKLDGKLSSHPLSNKEGVSGVIGDAINALIHLGYHPSQAEKAIKIALDKTAQEKGETASPELAQLITAALRCIKT